jgi:hypothetical protein
MDKKHMQLLKWMRQKKIFSTHEVMQCGLDMFYARADRTKRDFMKQGLIRKLSDWEKEMRNLKSKDAYYITNEKEIENYLQPTLF